MSEYIYDAFISYSHQDIQQARRLQRRLEAFHMPRGLEKERNGSAKLKIFRDQTDLAGAELQTSLEREMKAARYLIVICSPAAAASRWVNEEIRYFCSLGRADRIVPFIIEGEPNSDMPELECFPPVLRSEEVNELLGVNIHEIGKNKAFLKVASVLLDLRFNRLVDREKKRRQRTILVIAGIAAAVGIVTGALVWNNIQIQKKNQEITRENQEITQENKRLSSEVYEAVKTAIEQKTQIDPEDMAVLREYAEAGNTDAMVMLARCCYSMNENLEEAFSFMLRAAEAGNTEGMKYAGLFYMNGTGTPQDPGKAFQWFIRAADTEDADAMAYVAMCYEDGTGVEKDESKAFEYYAKSAMEENEYGLSGLASCFARGTGVEADPAKAFDYLKQVAEKTGDPYSTFNLGMMYKEGIGTEEDPFKAYVCFRDAAEAGFVKGMYMVGWCVENRYGMDSMEKIALEWYARALVAGYEPALQDVERIKNKMESGDAE